MTAPSQSVKRRSDRTIPMSPPASTTSPHSMTRKAAIRRPSRSRARPRHSEKALGPEHPDVATSLNNLAELYRAARPL